MTEDLLRTPVLDRLETYYDAAPRTSARTEELGPLTLFVQTDPSSWPCYARPRLGLTDAIDPEQVARVRERQRELDVPEAIEWVHETTPSLLASARAAGLQVTECPLLVHTGAPGVAAAQVRTEVLAPDSPDVATVAAAVDAAFRGVDDFVPGESGSRAEGIRAGTLVMVGVYDARGDVLGGGSHSPRGPVTELTGIAVLPRARRRGVGAAITAALVADAYARGVQTVFLSAQDDAVARVYERVGFVRVGTACIAEPGTPGTDARRVDD